MRVHARVDWFEISEGLDYAVVDDSMTSRRIWGDNFFQTSQVGV